MIHYKTCVTMKEIKVGEQKRENNNENNAYFYLRILSDHNKELHKNETITIRDNYYLLGTLLISHAISLARESERALGIERIRRWRPVAAPSAVGRRCPAAAASHSALGPQSTARRGASAMEDGFIS